MRDNLAGDLTLGAQWAIDLQAPAAAGGAPALNGNLHVFREKGDLIAGSEVPVALGLRVLDARADVSNGALRMQMELDGTRAGHAKVDATARMIAGRLGNDSPLKLSANADMGSIAWLAPLTGQPALEMDGTLKLDLAGGGTIGAPTLNGSVNGDNLALRWADQGVKLRNGQLRAQLAGDQLLLQRLSFDGVQGRAVADGAVRFSGGEATMQLKLVADKLEVLSRPDRTVVISGQSTLARDAKHFTLDGKFKVDRALVELAPQGRPVLSDDVIVIGRGKGAPADQGRKAGAAADGRYRGRPGRLVPPARHGRRRRTGGIVRLRAAGGRAPRVNGTIRVVSGTYAAYGQKLSIERGVLTFNGPYDNPALNILAVRKRPEGEQLTETNVEAGVEVSGTALAPVAKLVSTPSVPDSEKLSWLVLGHGMEGTSGNEAGVLSAAAGALLGGKGGRLPVAPGQFARRRRTGPVAGQGPGKHRGHGRQAHLGARLPELRAGRHHGDRAWSSCATSSIRASRCNSRPAPTARFDVLYSWAFD